MKESRGLPEGRLGRMARLAWLGVRSGADMVLEREGGGATQIAETLGTLRGLAAKLGQMASYVDGVVPEAQREHFESALRTLQAQAPRSSSSEVRRCLEQELGAPLDQLFAAWDDVPLASASIGQVHVARLLDGTEVAVKVQHPGIERALNSDLANMSMLEGLVSTFGGRRFDSNKAFAILRERFREELDYCLEAERLTYFASLHAGDPTVRVPRLFASHSTRRVLTTELVRGRDFAEACRAAPAERAGWAATIWRFVFKGMLVGGALNADPHPGNYIFHEDGVVTFLDYGCVQLIPAPMRTAALRAHRGAIARDDEEFRRGAIAFFGSRPGSLETFMIDYLRKCYAPMFESPYRITQSYAASLVNGMAAMKTELFAAKGDALFQPPMDMVFLNRLNFGLYSVLARLDAEVDYAGIERAFLSAGGADNEAQA